MKVNIQKIYIKLLNEGVEVWRPVEAKEISPNVFEILTSNEYDRDVEEWEFTPGTTVRCDEEEKSEGKVLVAKEKVE